MKQFFTLSVFFVLSLSARAQSQDFNTAGIINTLQANCWNFYAFYESTNNPINGARHLYVIPTTSTSNNPQSNSNVGQIASPFMDFTNGATIGFSYRLTSTLSTNAKRFITVRLWNASGSVVVSAITLDRLTPATTQTFSIVVAPNNGVRRLVIDFTGDGDGNTGMHFDDLLITGAPYSYNPTNCAALQPSEGNLPVKMISYSGNLVNKKAELKWTVDENETGNYFEIQKSSNGREFSTVGMLFTTQKSGRENYNFTESATLTQAAYFRLKVVNKDNSITYTKTVYLKPEGLAKSNELTLLQNPVQSALAFNYTTQAEGIATVNIYNSVGARVQTFRISVSKGINSVQQALSTGMTPGMYILEVINGTEKQVSKFNK